MQEIGEEIKGADVYCQVKLTKVTIPLSTSPMLMPKLALPFQDMLISEVH